MVSSLPAFNIATSLQLQQVLLQMRYFLCHVPKACRPGVHDNHTFWISHASYSPTGHDTWMLGISNIKNHNWEQLRCLRATKWIGCNEAQMCTTAIVEPLYHDTLHKNCVLLGKESSRTPLIRTLLGRESISLLEYPHFRGQIVHECDVWGQQ